MYNIYAVDITAMQFSGGRNGQQHDWWARLSSVLFFGLYRGQAFVRGLVVGGGTILSLHMLLHWN